MAEPHTPTSLTDTQVAIHTVPLPGEAKVLVFVEAKVSSTDEESASAAVGRGREAVTGRLERPTPPVPERVAASFGEHPRTTLS